MNPENWDFMAQPKVMKAKGKFRESENKEQEDPYDAYQSKNKFSFI